MARYRVTVDRDLCIQCGIAPNMCPQVFILAEDSGKNRVVEAYSETISDEVSVGVVPGDLQDCVEQAAEACPAQAITVEKID